MPCEPIRDRKKIREMLEVLSSRQNGFRDALFFEFALCTALRVSDIISLQKKDITNGVVRIKTEKTGLYRTIALNDSCRRKMDVFLEHKKPEDPIFDFKRQWAHKMIKWAADMVGLDPKTISMHSTRKTAGWHFYYDSGKDLVKTMHLLGHRSPSESLAYLMINEDEVNQQLIKSNWWSA